MHLEDDGTSVITFTPAGWQQKVDRMMDDAEKWLSLTITPGGFVVDPPPPTSSKFSLALAELQALHDKKNQDYGRTGDPYANVRGSQDFGIPPWIGALVRQNDKMRRLQKYARDGHLANESVEDSLLDNAVYAVIALVLWREAHGKDPHPPDPLRPPAVPGETGAV